MALESRRKIQKFAWRNLFPRTPTYYASALQCSEAELTDMYRSACFVNQERSQACRLSFRFLKQPLDSISEEENEKPNKLKSDLNSNIKWILIASDLGNEVNEVKFEQNAHKYNLKRTGVDWKGWWNFDAKKSVRNTTIRIFLPWCTRMTNEIR